MDHECPSPHRADGEYLSKRREEQKMIAANPEMPLYNIVDVVGAILVELNVVTWTFLCNDKNRIRVVRIKNNN